VNKRFIVFGLLAVLNLLLFSVALQVRAAQLCREFLNRVEGNLHPKVVHATGKRL
jgi:hypothetical protein